jgi:phosphoglycolate phosphatase
VTSDVRTVVFDLDGTLVDSRRDLAESANTVLQEAGGLPHPEEAIGRMVGDGAATLIARVFDAAGIPQPPGALARFLEIYNSRLLAHTVTYDGVHELLSTLSGRASLAVLTNKPLRATEAILEGLDLDAFFGPHVIGGDGPFPRKPDPSGLLHLVEVIGAAPHTTLLVGDSVIDWQTARAADARSCVARYGFGFDGFPVASLTGVERIIDHPLDLLAVL